MDRYKIKTLGMKTNRKKYWKGLKKVRKKIKITEVKIVPV
jgi:hypothetical protein